MNVFISGSISITSLEKDLLAYLEQIVEGNNTILIGDSSYGMDKLTQKYLFKCNYQNVIVYFSGKNPRNNIGNWQTKQSINSESPTGRSLCQLKDKAMADDCDCGLMFWGEKSKKTQRNIDYMEKLDKYFLVVSCGGLGVFNIHNINNMIML